MTHTLGPWHWAAPGDLRNEDGIAVGGDLDRLDLTDARWESDARLIAAAPDLLAACQEVLEGFRYENGRPIMAEWKMKEILAAAIARVEGT